MSTRDNILQAVRHNKPERQPLPELPSFDRDRSRLVESFLQAVEQVGGKGFLLGDRAEIPGKVGTLFPEVANILSTLPEPAMGNIGAGALADQVQLAALDVAVVPAQLGVAENGALWVTEADSGHRALSFIAQHLVLVLDRRHIAADMHEAYQRIKINDTGFGVFIAGPSKTADIEQALVVGAHGARSLTVLVV